MANAKYNGKCACGERFEAGASVTFSAGKVTACPTCNPQLGAERAPAAEYQFRIQRLKFVKDTFGIVEAVLVGAIPEDCPIQQGRVFSAKGPFGAVHPGDLLDVRGRFSQDPKWGWQFSAETAIPVVAGTDQALCAFLGRFKNIGQARAERILQHFGGRENTLAMLDGAPERLAEISGITPERAREIGDAYKAQSDLRDSALFLAGLSLGESLTAKILEMYGPDAKVILSEDPYDLMNLSGVGFKTADDVARKLQVNVEDPRRLSAAVRHLIEQATQEGHTWSTIEDLMEV